MQFKRQFRWLGWFSRLAFWRREPERILFIQLDPEQEPSPDEIALTKLVGESQVMRASIDELTKYHLGTREAISKLSSDIKMQFGDLKKRIKEEEKVPKRQPNITDILDLEELGSAKRVQQLKQLQNEVNSGLMESQQHAAKWVDRKKKNQQ